MAVYFTKKNKQYIRTDTTKSSEQTTLKKSFFLYCIYYIIYTAWNTNTVTELNWTLSLSNLWRQIKQKKLNSC